MGCSHCSLLGLDRGAHVRRMLLVRSKWQGVSSEGERAMHTFKDAAGYSNISYF
jgi:hypothetical protein